MITDILELFFIISLSFVFAIGIVIALIILWDELKNF